MSENIQKFRFLSLRLPPASAHRIIVLTGARQTGKTTLAKMQYADLNYINLDAPENRETLKALPTPAWANTVGHAVIDEVQKEPALFEKVKYAFDEGGISFTVLTGSSQILLLKNIRESLAGRAFFYELCPLMLSEIDSDRKKPTTQPPLIDFFFSNSSLKDVLGSAPLYSWQSRNTRFDGAKIICFSGEECPDCCHYRTRTESSG